MAPPEQEDNQDMTLVIHFPIEEVHHEEPGAWIPPQEAAQIADARHSGWVQFNADAPSLESLTSVPEVVDAESHSLNADHDVAELPDTMHGEVRLLTFTRTGGLDNALLDSEELREVREALQRAGLNILLWCGAKVLVAPEEYASVMAAVQGITLAR